MRTLFPLHNRYTQLLICCRSAPFGSPFVTAKVLAKLRALIQEDYPCDEN
jgi:hypothetical protein